MKCNVMTLAVASALSLVAASEARASAFALHEQGVAGLGNAYAGAAAVAEDANTVWWNPAGMARLKSGKHFAGGGALIVPSTKFSNGASALAPLNATLGGTGGDAGDKALVPSFFFAMDLGPKWNFGVGVSVPFGLATEYDATWIGRFHGITSEVKTLNINPSVSYKINDGASIGAGISYQRGEIDLLSGVNYAAAANGALGANIEGQSRIGLDGDAWGFNLGGLFNVGTSTRIGIHYRSPLKYKMDGSVSFSGRPAALAAAIPDGKVKFDFKTPDTLAFSVAHQLNQQWELLADATWTHWSVIKQIPLVRTDGALSGATLDTLTFNFKDTWRTSIGANYKMSDAWKLRMGAAYDQSPVPDATSRTVRLPDNDRYWLSIGARWQASPAGVLDLGYSYIKVKNADINQTAAGRGTVNGTYKATVHVLGVQYQHTF